MHVRLTWLLDCARVERKMRVDRRQCVRRRRSRQRTHAAASPQPPGTQRGAGCLAGLQGLRVIDAHL